MFLRKLSKIMGGYADADTVKLSVLVRVDERFVHGQIIETWVPYTKANTIVVINEALSRDSLMRGIIESAVPRNITVLVKDFDEGIGYLLEAHDETEHYSNPVFQSVTLKRWFRDGLLRSHRRCERTIVIFADLKDAIKAYHMGFHFKKLNLGNLHNPCQLKMLTQSVYLGVEDIDIINELKDAGVILDVRAVPSDRAYEVKECLL